MKFNNKGIFQKALNELKNDKNNAVAEIFEYLDYGKNGVLKDVVFTLKNNYAKNFGTTDASSNLLISFNPNYNATILDKLINSGAKLVATTNLDEFGLGGTGEYSNRGLILHPFNKEYLVGGSSSGAAATFTNNIGFAIGSDTGDSVRLPASNIGKVGFKPSYGAVSRYGLFAYASSLDTVGWFTHNVNDSAVVAQTLYGKDKLDLTSIDVPIKNIKISKPKIIAYLNCFDDVDNYIKNSYCEFLKKIENSGIVLIPIEVDINLLKSIKIVYEIISFSEASSNLSNLNGVSFGQRKTGDYWEEIFSNTRSDGFGFMIQKRLALGSYYLEKENQQKFLIKAQKVRRLISDWFTNIHHQADVFIYPSTSSIASLAKEVSKTNKTDDYMSYILTAANLVGNPSLNLKLGEYNDMPFNLTVDTFLYNDENLFSYALFIEKILLNEKEKSD